MGRYPAYHPGDSVEPPDPSQPAPQPEPTPAPEVVPSQEVKPEVEDVKPVVNEIFNAPRQRKDVLGYKSPNPLESCYTYDDVQIEDIPTEEREELLQEINKEVTKYVNC